MEKRIDPVPVKVGSNLQNSFNEAMEQLKQQNKDLLEGECRFTSILIFLFVDIGFFAGLQTIVEFICIFPFLSEPKQLCRKYRKPEPLKKNTSMKSSSALTKPSQRCLFVLRRSEWEIKKIFVW